MATASRKANRVIETATASIAREVSHRSAQANALYARDPFRHLDEGHVVVLDLETVQPVRLDPWPHQRALIADWVDLDHLRATGVLRWRNVHEIKSRQMGITWIVAYVLVWALRWHPVHALVMSLKIAEIADPGLTTDSFFGRMRYIVDYRDPEDAIEPLGGWPDSLRPRFRFTGGNDPVVRGQADGFAAGTGAVPDPGRGGRYDVVFLDEHARLPFGRAVQAAITRAAPTGRLYNSTVDGEDNEFWRLRQTRPSGYRFRRDHWTSHPVYSVGLHTAAALDDEGKILVRGQPDCEQCRGVLAGEEWRADAPERAHRYPGRPTSPWYERAIIDLTDEDVASELEIDPAASLTARVYPEFREDLHVAAVEIPLLPGVPIELGWDYGYGTTSVVIAQDTPREYRFVGEVELHESLPEDDAKAVRKELRALGLGDADLYEPTLRRTLMVGDPAGEATEKGLGRSLHAEYNQRFGFHIIPGPNAIYPTIRAVRRMLNGRPKDVVVSQRCPLLAYHWKHNRWPTDRQGNPKPDPAEPKNDEHNHMMRATAYLVAYKYPAPDRARSIAAAARKRERGRSEGRISGDVGYEMKL